MKNKHIDTLITVASWEPRFFKGLEKWFQSKKCDKIIVFYYSKYKDHTIGSRTKLKKILEKKEIKYIEIELMNYDPVNSWLSIRETIKKEVKGNQEIVLDITTMPRETIWTILNTIQRKKAEISITYTRPWRYNKDWLTREPEDPRIVYKLGGIAKFNYPTNLLILSGFDMERIDQLISYYEPKKIIIGIHKDTKYSEQRELFNKKIKEYGNTNSADIFYFNAYAGDFGYKEIEKNVKPFTHKSYLLISSLGPKPGALALYKLHLNYKYSGLVYIPCKDYNLNYSYGIRDCISKKLKL